MQIKIKYHDPEHKELAFIDGEKSDWVDLRSAVDIYLEAGEFAVIPLGVSMKLPDGYEAHLAPRSSTFMKWGIIQTNSVGVIDNSYSGENDVWGFPALAMRNTVISKGDRICQFRLIKKMDPVTFVTVDHMEGEDRGGFGSTGHQ